MRGARSNISIAPAILLAGAYALLSAAPAAQAQNRIATDGTLGVAVDRNGNFSVIEPGLGQRAGDNLFHSFRTFSVGDGAVTVFGVPDGVGRVISRVTGAEASAIDGLISFADALTLSRPVAADFWFFNPNGVIVGPNATFRTSGALYLSGGDSVVFSDGATFSSNTDRALNITSATPEAFGFLDRQPGPVVVRGTRIVGRGDGVALSGGRVTIDGAVLTAGAQDLVIITGGQGDLAPVAPDPASGGRNGSIRILGDGASGGATGSIETLNGGGVTLQSGRIVIDGGRVLSTADELNGGSVKVGADSLILRNGGLVASLTIGDGRAGAIDVVARDILLRRGGSIRSQTRAAGDAGRVSVAGFDLLRVSRGQGDDETAIESEVAPGAAGDANLVRLRGGVLELIDGGSVFSSTFGDGDAGAVDVRVDSIVATGGGQIASGARDNPTVATRATGAGGSVTVIARDSMTFGGTFRPRPTDPPDAELESSGILTATEGRFTGRGGDLFARAPTITLSNEAEIGAETFFAARAGDLTLQGASLRVEGGAEISTTSRGAGAAGDVTLGFAQLVHLPSAGSIASNANDARGTAGSVTIDTAALMIGPASSVSTSSLASDGGSIVVTATAFAAIDSGRITTSVASSDGNGGAITINGGPLVLSDGAIIASTAQSGDGGTVTINSSAAFIEPPDSNIDVSSALGNDGTILFAGVVNDEAAETEAPPAEFFNRFALIDDFCVAAVTGGSALRLVAPAAPAVSATTAPALFGGAIPYPVAGVAAAPMTLAGAPDAVGLCGAG